MFVPENLKALRLHSMFTQAEVAEAIHVTRTSYAHFEKGDRYPDLNTLYTLATLFGVHMDAFFLRTQRRFLSDAVFYTFMIDQEKQLLADFALLSDLGKGRLLERIKSILEEEETLARQAKEPGSLGGPLPSLPASRGPDPRRSQRRSNNPAR